MSASRYLLWYLNKPLKINKKYNYGRILLRTVREYHELRTMFNPILEHLKSNFPVFFLFFCFLWQHWASCGILVPQPGIEPGPRQWKCPVITTGEPGNSLQFLNRLFWPLVQQIVIKYILHVMHCSEIYKVFSNVSISDRRCNSGCHVPFSWAQYKGSQSGIQGPLRWSTNPWNCVQIF